MVSTFGLSDGLLRAVGRKAERIQRNGVVEAKGAN